MGTINLGVIGLGRMGRIFSRHIAGYIEGARLAAVSSRTPDVAARVASQGNNVKIYSNYRDLLADTTIDGVIIATLTHTHHDIVIAAAEAGKAIFCEKPIALTLTETEAMLAAVEQAGVPFQIGASHMSPQISLERIRRAALLKPGAIQVILSDWFPLRDDEIIACLSRMAEAADPIGLVLYNPPHAKTVLKPEQYAAIKSYVPSLVGIKVAGGDEAWYAEMRQSCPEISIFVPGHHLATGFSRGASGAYSNVACLHPVGGQAWYNLMTRDLNKALALESRIQHFMAGYIAPFITEQGYSNQAADKLLAA